MTDLTNMETYKLYKKLSPRALPEMDMDDPMHLAEQAEAEGDLAFLAKSISDHAPVPESLMDRAIALGPRTVQRASLWKQIVAATLTFLAFGSGSYALANGLSVETVVEIDPFTATDGGLFDAATDSGFFSFE